MTALQNVPARCVIRNICRTIHMGRVVPEVQPEIAEQIINKEVNLKHVPTRRNLGFVAVPAQLDFAAQTKISRIADGKFRQDARGLISLMYNLKLPDDEHTLRLKRADIKMTLELRDKIKSRPERGPSDDRFDDEIASAKSELHKLIDGTLENRRRDWHYYEYDEYASALYMATRLAPNYAAVRSVMKEICDLHPDFKPKSVLDFGSGMGTTIWAVNETWPKAVDEFMNIELSKEQQHLCEFLLRGGREFGSDIGGVFHREYLPASNKTKYDIVVAAYSMLELPNFELRAQTIENLWHKTNEFLVFIERGNRGGFSIINEARHFILDLTGHDVTSKISLSPDIRLNSRNNPPDSHICGPCPHEFACPRASMSSKKERDYCKFRVFFEPISLGHNTTKISREDFSYVILRKGPHPNYNSIDQIRWPRIVEKRSRSSGLLTHRLCCPNGHLAEVVVTKKRYGKAAWEIAKTCDWGDVMPFKIHDTYMKRSQLLEAPETTVSPNNEPSK